MAAAATACRLLRGFIAFGGSWMKAADRDEGKYLGSEAAIMTITRRPNMTLTAPRAAHVTDTGHLTFSLCDDHSLRSSKTETLKWRQEQRGEASASSPAPAAVPFHRAWRHLGRTEMDSDRHAGYSAGAA